MAPPTRFRPRKAMRITLPICLLARNTSKLHNTYLIPALSCLRCGIAAPVANSLCRGRDKRTMHKPEVQIGASGSNREFRTGSFDQIRLISELEGIKWPRVTQ